METSNRKTPLYGSHINAGGKIVDFHGWLLPVQYSGILHEHESVRTKAGLFDVSHMGEIEVSGSDAFSFLQKMMVNDITAAPGKAVYSPMCYPDGGTVDDLIIYKQNSDTYLLVVNASNTDKDFQWLCDNAAGSVSIVNRSDEYAQLALQGPEAAAILAGLTDDGALPGGIKYFRYVNDASIGGIKVMLSRTGYTGEDGFELYCRPDDAQKLWDMLIDAGAAYGLVPAGLGARDTLRMEAALPLYGQELSESISPVMAGLNRFIRPDKGGFIGRDALAAQLDGDIKQKIAGFEMIDRAVPRTGYEISQNGVNIGQVTSGGYFPTLKKNMGLALIDTSCVKEGNNIEVTVRGGKYAARIINLPFYKRQR
jgi:aminomethyltransferase